MANMVSVLMTAYNRQDFIAEATESVLSSIFTDFELIIVDDGSKDNTVEIARSYEKLDKRIKVYVNEKNLGDYVNRNKAASYARGKYIKYLDSDDLMYPHCLQVMVQSMEKFPEAGFGLSAVRDNEVPYPVCLTSREIYLEHFNGYGHFNRSPGSAIIKKTVFNKVGGFSGKRYIGDVDLWFRLAQQFPMVKFPADLYWSRIHTASEGSIERGEKTAEMRKQLIKSFLESPQCPIDPKEVRVPLIKQVKRSIKKFL
jgi:glycosyltransferase involved in cell wall biosynthesis